MMNNRKKTTAAAAAYILGLSPGVKIRGDAMQLSVFREALDTSRDVYLLLRDGSSQDTLAESLEAKSDAAQKFEKTFGYGWPF